MVKLTVAKFIDDVKHYSNMPLDIAIILEPFGLFVEPYDFEGVLLGVFLEDLIEQYASEEKIDVYAVLELVAFYAKDSEIDTIIHSLLLSTKHGACHSL